MCLELIEVIDLGESRVQRARHRGKQGVVFSTISQRGLLVVMVLDHTRPDAAVFILASSYKIHLCARVVTTDTTNSLTRVCVVR